METATGLKVGLGLIFESDYHLPFQTTPDDHRVVAITPGVMSRTSNGQSNMYDVKCWESMGDGCTVGGSLWAKTVQVSMTLARSIIDYLCSKPPKVITSQPHDPALITALEAANVKLETLSWRRVFT